MKILIVILHMLNGTATSDEQILMNAWLAESSANVIYFEEIKTVADNSEFLLEIELLDVDNVWLNFMGKLEKQII